MTQQKRFSLNGLQLKLLGWGFTICMACAFCLFPWTNQDTGKMILYYLGYCSLPIFAFLLTEGYENTGDIKKYLLATLLAGFAAEPMYDYACQGILFGFSQPNGQNLMFGLFLGLLQLMLLERMGTGSFGKVLGCSLLVFCAGVWTWLMNIPGGFYFQLCVGIFYLLKRRPAGFWAVAALTLLAAWPAVLVLPLMACYGGERGRYCKWLFYGAWVALWAVFALVRLLGV